MRTIIGKLELYFPPNMARISTEDVIHSKIRNVYKPKFMITKTIVICITFYDLNSQGRRTSERFIKPAIPTPSLGLNTSAPNIMSHHILGGGVGSPHIAGTASSSTNSTIGSNPNSLNSSLSSASNTTLPNISFSGHSSSFTQPASPMDTSVCKD